MILHYGILRIDHIINDEQIVSYVEELIQKDGRTASIYVDLTGLTNQDIALQTASALLEKLRTKTSIYEPVIIGPAIGEHRAIGYEAVRLGLRPTTMTYDEFWQQFE